MYNNARTLLDKWIISGMTEVMMYAEIKGIFRYISYQSFIIGAAIISGCDCIISWNFKHIVNVKTIRGIRASTNLEGYKVVEIWNPSVLLESEG